MEAHIPGVWGGTTCLVFPMVALNEPAFLRVDALSMGSMVVCLNVLGGWPPGRDDGRSTHGKRLSQGGKREVVAG